MRFVINKNKIARHYKLQEEHEQIYTDKNLLEESEIVVLSNKAIQGIHRYLTRIEYYVKPSREFDIFKKQLKIYTSKYYTPTKILK